MPPRRPELGPSLLPSGVGVFARTVGQTVGFTVAVAVSITVSVLVLFGTLVLIERIVESTARASLVALGVYAATIALATYLLVVVDDHLRATADSAESESTDSESDESESTDSESDESESTESAEAETERESGTGTGSRSGIETEPAVDGVVPEDPGHAAEDEDEDGPGDKDER